MPVLRFVVHRIGHGDRLYRVTPDEVRYVLQRLPRELWGFLRTVYFSNQMGSDGCLGYACYRDRSLTLTALPRRFSFAHYCERQECRPEEFGATFGRQWPDMAVRRFLLYYVLLHELAHLQRLPRGSRNPGERMAREFAHYWRQRLWSQPVEDGQDPVHRPPSAGPTAPPSVDWLFAQDRASEAREVLLEKPQPHDPMWQAWLGLTYLKTGDYHRALEHFPHAEPDDRVLFQWGRCYHHLRQWDQAAELFQRSLALRDHPTVRRWLEATRKRRMLR